MAHVRAGVAVAGEHCILSGVLCLRASYYQVVTSLPAVRLSASVAYEWSVAHHAVGCMLCTIQCLAASFQPVPRKWMDCATSWVGSTDHVKNARITKLVAAISTHFFSLVMVSCRIAACLLSMTTLPLGADFLQSHPDVLITMATCSLWRAGAWCDLVQR